MVEADGKSLHCKDVLSLSTSVKALRLISKLLHLAGIAALCRFISSTYLEHELTVGLCKGSWIHSV